MRECLTLSIISRQVRQVQDQGLKDYCWGKWQHHEYVLRPVYLTVDIYTRNECSDKPVKDLVVSVPGVQVVLTSAQVECFNAILAWKDKWELYDK